MINNLQNKIKALVLALHISQTSAIAFFFQGLVGILRENGVPLKYLSFIYFLGIFIAIRFLWAPLLDKIKFGKFGHYKVWLIIFECLIIANLLIMSLLSASGSFVTIILFCVMFAFFASSQDIAIDALVYKICHTSNQRNIASSLKTAGSLIGAIIGGGAILFFYDKFGWRFAMLFLVFITLIPLIFMLSFKELDTEYKNPKSKFILVEFYHFWKTKKRLKWLMFLLLAPMPICMSSGIFNPMMVDMGISLTIIGIVHTAGNVSGAVSSFLSGGLVNRFGRKTILVISAILQAFAIFSLYILIGDNLSGKYDIIIAGIVVATILFFFSPILTCILGYILDEIQEKRLIGSQYAIQHGVLMISEILTASIGLMLAGLIGYKSVIMICVLVSFIVAYMGYKKEDK